MPFINETVIVGRNPGSTSGAQTKALVSTAGHQLVDTFHQDQSTRPFDISANVTLDATITLSAVPTVGSYDVDLTAGHGVITGDWLAFLEQNGDAQIYFGKVLNVVTNTITMDTQVPFAFTPAETTILKYDNNLAVNGAVTPVTAAITNVFTCAVDITRFIFHITDGTSMDDGKFGGMTALTRGVAVRKKLLSGNYVNYFNVKTNGEFGELAYDVGYDAKAPAGVYGFRCRLTYAGEAKHGVVIRLEPGESIELLVQDDLTDLLAFTMMVQGHFTD